MRGAVDFVPKPAAATDIHTVVNELILKIKIAATAPLPVSMGVPADTTPPPPPAKLPPRPFRRGDPLIVIGASTGGPRALQHVLSALPTDLPAAILMIQHMPPNFTRALAQRMNEHTSLTVQEAAHGDRLARGIALLAPGNFHLQINRQQVVLNQDPRRNGVRPAADVTMESAAEQHSSAVIGVVLTGMGSDGTDGARSIKANGGRIVAQDQASCAVYGMPRSVIEAGLADRVVPLEKVASTLLEMTS
jgi:two-component system chemotaxis response regulator CheB